LCESNGQVNDLIGLVSTPPDAVPDDFETLKSAFLAERAARKAGRGDGGAFEAEILPLRHSLSTPSAPRPAGRPAAAREAVLTGASRVASFATAVGGQFWHWSGE
jgi:hypothetical protein